MSELDKEFLIAELYRNLLEGDVKLEPMRTYYCIIWKISDDEIYNLPVELAMTGTHDLIHDLAFSWSTILKRHRAKEKKNV